MCKYFHDIPGGLHTFHCPGCGFHHTIDDRIWITTWSNGKPTLTPSVLNKQSGNQNRVTCHLFIRNGQIQYLDDCAHDLKGQTVDMELIPPLPPSPPDKRIIKENLDLPRKDN